MALIQERKKGNDKVAQSNLTHNCCLSAAFYGGGQGALKDVGWFTVKLGWLSPFALVLVSLYTQES